MFDSHRHAWTFVLRSTDLKYGFGCGVLGAHSALGTGRKRSRISFVRVATSRSRTSSSARPCRHAVSAACGARWPSASMSRLEADKRDYEQFPLSTRNSTFVAGRDGQRLVFTVSNALQDKPDRYALAWVSVERRGIATTLSVPASASSRSAHHCIMRRRSGRYCAAL